MGDGAGLHLIAGEWMEGPATFRSEPATGEARAYAVGTPDLVERVARAAEAAFPAYAATSREDRARFLDRIASEIEARGEAVTEAGASTPVRSIRVYPRPAPNQ